MPPKLAVGWPASRGESAPSWGGGAPTPPPPPPHPPQPQPRRPPTPPTTPMQVVPRDESGYQQSRCLASIHDRYLRALDQPVRGHHHGSGRRCAHRGETLQHLVLCDESAL